MITLYNGYMIPSEAYGTGVIKRFYRNKFLYIKDEFIAILKSVKHKKIERRLYNDLCIGHMLDIAIKNGYKLFDTGRLYGHSERKIGKKGFSIGMWLRRVF